MYRPPNEFPYARMIGMYRDIWAEVRAEREQSKTWLVDCLACGIFEYSGTRSASEDCPTCRGTAEIVENKA